MSNKSLIDIGKFSEPLGKLFDHIANAVGVLYEPTRTIKKAKASAKAIIIQKEAEIVAQSIERRALTRLQLTEIKRQLNIESILEKSLPLFDPETDFVENATTDWLSEFFKFAQDISDEEVQLLWAKVLANQVNGKSGYSFRTLDILRQLESDIAVTFKKFTAAAITNQSGVSFLISHDIVDEEVCESLLEFAQLTYTEIEDLMSIGLVVETPFHRILDNLYMEYHLKGRKVTIRFIKWYLTGLLKIFEVYRLTREGQELASLTEKQVNIEYTTYVDSILRGCGLFYEPSGKSDDKTKQFHHPRSKI